MSDAGKSILSVLAANVGALAVTILSNVELILKIISLCLAIGYTIWRWWEDYKNKKNKKQL